MFELGKYSVELYLGQSHFLSEHLVRGEMLLVPFHRLYSLLKNTKYIVLFDEVNLIYPK